MSKQFRSTDTTLEFFLRSNAPFEVETEVVLNLPEVDAAGELQDTTAITLRESAVSYGNTVPDRLRIEISNIQENAEARAGNTTLKITFPDLYNWDQSDQAYRVIQLLNWTEIGSSGTYRANRAYNNSLVTVTRNIYAVSDGSTLNASGNTVSWTQGQQIATLTIIRGLVSNCTLRGSAEKGGTVTFGITNNWGDFVRVNGRVTSDSAHRALGINGSPDLEYLKERGQLKYATDYGFIHADRSISTIAKYTTKELRYKSKRKGGFSGWFGAREIKEYYEDVEREIDLRFNLSAKHLPVIYGVQKASSVPIFADVSFDTPTGEFSSDQTVQTSTVYLAAAICEGEIGGIMDIHIDENPLICIDDLDETDRGISNQGEDTSIPVTCYGRMDRGYVLKGALHFDPTVVAYANYYNNWAGARNIPMEMDGGGVPSSGVHYGSRGILANQLGNFLGQNANLDGGNGLGHEQAFSIQEQKDVPKTSFIVHTGKPFQRANQLMLEKANQEGFTFQNTSYVRDPTAYWTNNHRLLDTAYVVARMQITDTEYSVPDMEFVVKGKYIQCYNYDKSFAPLDPVNTETDDHAANFILGDTVEVIYDGSSQYSTTIIDKFFIFDKNGNKQWRFRLEAPISDDDVEDYKRFKLKKQDGQDVYEWEMVSYDYTKQSSLTFNDQRHAPEFSTDVTWVLNPQSENIELTFINNSGTYHTLISDIIGSVGTDSQNIPIDVYLTINDEYIFRIKSVSSITADVVELDTESSQGLSFSQNVASDGITSLKLSNVVTITDSGYTIEENDLATISYSSPSAISGKQETATVAKYFAYSGNNYAVVFKDIKLLLNGTDNIGDTNQTISFSPNVSDFRVSTNPAMQLLDYVTSDTYGGGLTNSEIDFESWLDAATICDAGSDIVVYSSGFNASNVGTYYKILTADGKLMWRGQYAGVYEDLDGTPYGSYHRFTNCSGKLGRKFNTYTPYLNGELVWNNGVLKQTSQEGTLADFAAFSALSAAGTVTLTPETGTGGNIDIDTTTGPTAEGNPLVRGPGGAPGYSLHDADLVKYWKYVGWESPDQRWVTRHQMNQVINTDSTVFQNINSMLRQFNGIMTYSDNKYYLNIKTAMPVTYPAFTDGQYAIGDRVVYNEILWEATSQGTYTEEPTSPSWTNLGPYYWRDGITIIRDEDIIGDITIKDIPKTEKYNAITASIPDPAKLFANNTINFFDSDALKEDRNIFKKGNYAVPGITNYLAARTNVIQYLEESREAANISFTLDPKAYLLFVGNVIKIQSDTLNWGVSGDGSTGKTVRIQSLTLNKDGTFNVNAKEHDDFNYLIAYERRNANEDPLSEPPEPPPTFSIARPLGLQVPNTGTYAPYKGKTIGAKVRLPQGLDLSKLDVEFWILPWGNPGPNQQIGATFWSDVGGGTYTDRPTDFDTSGPGTLDVNGDLIDGNYGQAYLAATAPADYWGRYTPQAFYTLGNGTMKFIEGEYFDIPTNSADWDGTNISLEKQYFIDNPSLEPDYDSNTGAGTSNRFHNSITPPVEAVESRYRDRKYSVWCRLVDRQDRSKVSAFTPPKDAPDGVGAATIYNFSDQEDSDNIGNPGVTSERRVTQQVWRYGEPGLGADYRIDWPSQQVIFVADSDGNIADLSGSLGRIRVYRNDEELTYGDSSQDHFHVEATANNIVIYSGAPNPLNILNDVNPSGFPHFIQSIPGGVTLYPIEGFSTFNDIQTMSGTITYTVYIGDSATGSRITPTGVESTFVRYFTVQVLGSDTWKISATNESHAFVTVPGSVNVDNDFTCDFLVQRATGGGSLATYDWSSDTSAGFTTENGSGGFYRYIENSLSGTNCIPRVDTADGTVTIDANSDILTDEEVTSATIIVPFEALHRSPYTITGHTTLYPNGIAGATTTTTLPNIPDPPFKVITLNKIERGVRGGEIFIIEAGAAGLSLTEAQYNEWATDPLTNTYGGLDDILSYVMTNLSADGFIRPNDVITIKNNLISSEETSNAATRIYTGAGTNVSTVPGTSSFSTLVTDTFDGSVLVKGTLSADRLAANQGIFNQLKVGSNLVVGEEPSPWVEGQVYGLGSTVRPRVGGPANSTSLFEYFNTTPSTAQQETTPGVSGDGNEPGGPNSSTYWTEYTNTTYGGWVYSRDHTTFGDTSAGFYMDNAGNFEARTGSGGGLSVDAENDIVTLTGTTIIKGVGGNLVTFTTTGNAVLSDQGDDVSLTTGSGTVYSNSTSKSPTAIAVVGDGDRDFEFGLLDAATSEQDLANTATNHDYSWFYDSSASTVTARDGGVDISGTTLTAVPNDTLQVVHDGEYVRFLLGSRLVKTITLPSVDGTIYLWFGTFTDTVASGTIAENIAFQRGASSSGNDVAPTVDLIAPQTIFYYDKEGNRVGSGNITLTALASGTLGYTVYYQFVVDGVAQGMQGGNTFSYTPPSTRPVDDSINITAEIRYVNNASAEVVGTSTIALNFADESESPTQIQYTNENVVLVSDAEGNVTDFTDSGTVIEVIEGFTALDARSPGDALNPGEFKITSVTNTGSKVTLDANPTPSGTTITYGNITAMDSATDSHTVTYNLEIRTFNGTTQNRSVSQSFTKAKAGNEVAHWEYTNTAHAVPTDDSGTSANFSGSGGTLQVYWGADLQTYTSGGTPGTYPSTAGQYRVEIARTSGDSTVSSGALSGTTAVTVGDFSSTGSSLTDVTTFDVDIYLKTPTTNDGTSKNVLLTFQISLTPSKQGTGGAGGLSGVLTNESHTVGARADGTGYSLTGAGGTFNVFSGASDVTTSSTFSGTATQNGLTITINSTTGAYTLSGASWTSDEETFTLTATYNSQNISKIYTISKAKDGANGEAARITSVSPSATFIGYSANPTSTSTGNPNQITFSWDYQGYTNPVYAWRYRKGTGAYSSWITDANASVTITSTYGVAGVENIVKWDTGTAHTIEVRTSEGIQGTDASTDVFSVGKGADGADGSPAKSVRLTASSQVFKVAKDGTVTPNSITFDATLQNTNDSTATFSASPAVTLGGTGNQKTLSYANFSISPNAAKGPVTVTATADTSFSDSITVVQVEEGSDAVVAVLGNESHTFQANNAGTVSDFSGGTTTIQVFEGATALDFNSGATSAGEFTMTRSTSGITAPAVSSYLGNGTATCTTGAPTAMSADNATITFNITGNRADGTAFSISKVQSFSKSKEGADGDGGLSGVLTNESHTVAANADGTGYSLTGAGGTFNVFSGASDETANSTFSVSGTATKNGLTISINSAGVYTLSGASWTSDEETFTLTATYNSNSISKTYTISKAKAGADGEDPKLVSIEPLSRQAIEFNANEVIGSSTAITMISNSTGFTDPYFSYTPTSGSWFSFSEYDRHDGDNTNGPGSDTVTISPNTTYSNYPVQITVNVHEGDTATVVAQDTVTLFAVKPGADGTSGEGSAVAYTRSATAPTATGSTNPPGGSTTWYTTVAATTGSLPLWIVNGTRAAGGTTWSWGTPQLYKGDAPGIFIVVSASSITSTNDGITDAVNILKTNAWPFTERTYLVEGDQIFVRSTSASTTYDVRVLECIATDFPTVGVGGNLANTEVQLQETTFIDGNLMVDGTIAGEALIIHSPFSAGNSSITITDNPNPKIEIYDSGTLRVKLGYLL